MRKLTPTPYDTIAYPSVVQSSVQPEPMAVAAKLAGLDPVPLDQARVLEIGGGTCFGLIAFAAANPGSSCHGIDLAATAIARGQELAGDNVPNVTLAVADIMTAHELYPAGSFDYVIAHGVYAWVPEPVRRALLKLVAHVLSDRGVALISYNAMPGGHIRLILRETVLHAVAGIDDPQERVAQAYAFLEDYAQPQEGDEPLLVALRGHAESMLKRLPGVLFHDEMAEFFAPVSLSDFVHAAGDYGLKFLNDAGRNRSFDGFLKRDAGDVADPDGQVLRAAQARDYREICFFRATLLVPNAAPVDRRIDSARMEDMWISAEFETLSDGEFRMGQDRFTVSDPQLAQALAELASIAPARRPVREIANNDHQRQVLLALRNDWFVMFHLGPAGFVLSPGDKPETGAWTRGMLLRGERDVVSFTYTQMHIDQPELRALLIATDGTRSLAELATMDHGIPADQTAAALQSAAQKGLLLR